MKHVRLRSRFTHDAARAGDSVHVCNTEAGEVQTLAYPTMDLVSGVGGVTVVSVLFAQLSWKQHARQPWQVCFAF